MIQLREYQLQGVEDIRNEIRKGHKRILVVAPTGSGKTLLAAEIIKKAYENYNASLFFAHRRELITQASSKLAWAGIDHGIMLSGIGYARDKHVYVSSVQTFSSWVVRHKHIDPPEAKVVIIDECHRVMSGQYQKIIAMYPDSIFIGVTATPIRSDGVGLGNFFQAMVQLPQIPWLIENKFLVPVKYVAPADKDLIDLIKGVRTKGHDFDPTEMEKVIDRPQYVGDVVENWLRIAQDRTTLMFALSVAHSVHIRDTFRSVGVLAEHVDDSTPKNERERVFKDLSEGKIPLVTNVGIATEGTDIPRVSCVSLVRPTKSLGPYLQMAGRGTRPFEGKENLLVMDHVGNLDRHGRIDREFPWSLDSKKKIIDRIKEAVPREKKDLICPNCDILIREKPPCPECGWMPTTPPKYLEYIDAALQEVEKFTRRKKEIVYTEQEMMGWFQEILGYCEEKGWKSNAAAHIFRKKFKFYPRKEWNRLPALMPSQIVSSFIKHQMRRRAYGIKKAGK
jgi:DNA repair protein RadD